MQQSLKIYKNKIYYPLSAAIALVMILSVMNKNGSQPAALLLLLLSVPLCFLKRSDSVEPLSKQQWLLMLIAPILVSIPLFVASGTGEALAAPARYLAAAVCLIGLYHFRFTSQLVLRSASAGAILAIVVHPDQYNAVRTNWGIGHIESAYVMIVLLSFALAQLHLDWKNIIWRLFAIIAIVTCVVAVIWTGTRGAWPAVVIVFLLYLSLLKIPRLYKWIMLVVIILVVVASSRLVPTISERVDDTAKELKAYYMDSNHSTPTGYRLDFWWLAIEAFKENPVWGVSYQRRSELMKNYIHRYPERHHMGTDGRHSSHNEILEGLSKKGLIGLLAILMLYIIPLRFFTRYLKSECSDEVRYASMAGIGMVLAMIFCGLTEAPLMNLRIATAYAFFLVFLYHLITQLSMQNPNE